MEGAVAQFMQILLCRQHKKHLSKYTTMWVQQNECECKFEFHWSSNFRKRI